MRCLRGLVLLGCVGAAQLATAQPISAEELGRILDYPAARIAVTDITVERNRLAAKEGFPPRISWHAYQARDNTFAPVEIAVAREGALLTAEMRTLFDGMIAEDAQRPVPIGYVRPLEIAGLARGFIGLTMQGERGSTEAVVLHLPRAQRDIEITLRLPKDAPLPPLAEAPRYREIMGSVPALRARLAAVAEVVAHSAATQKAPPAPHPGRSYGLWLALIAAIVGAVWWAVKRK